MTGLPLIGITGRRLSGAAITTLDPRYRGAEIDVVFNDYARCVAAAGAIPVYLPYQARADEVIGRIDGVLITGGQDIEPSCWGRPESADGALAPDRTRPGNYDPDRDDYEVGLAHIAVERGVPVLGVCRGAQVLNVSRGGTLVDDLTGGRIEHYSSASAPDAGASNHVVQFAEGTRAHEIFGDRLIRNSWHHQSIDVPGRDLIVSGWTDDGVVESIEIPDRPALGVQWHPEWQPGGDAAIDWLVRCARDRACSAVR